MIVGLVLAEVAGFCVGAIAVWRREWLSRLPQRPTLVVLASLSAAAAVLAPGSPTGWRPMDVVLRALLASGCVLLAARARHTAVLVASVLAVAATFGSGWQLLAMATLGLLLADALAPRHSPLLAALAAGAIAQVALHLERPDGRGQTALLAAVVLAPIVLSGLVRLPRALRRRVLGVAAVGGCLAVVASASALLAAGSARDSLERGVSLLKSAAVTPGGSTDPAAAAGTLEAAEKEFSAARSTLGNPLVRPAGAVPVVGQQWSALYDAAVTGEEVSAVGLRAARSPGARAISVDSGQVPLDQLARLQPLLDDLAQRLDAGSERLEAARSPWLLPALDRRLQAEHARLVPVQKGARAAADVVPKLPAILGAQGPRRYFLAVQTPAEQRATGGFIGNFGEIVADQGKLSLARFQRIADLVPSEVATIAAPPDYLARYNRFQGSPDWRNVNVSPDFPTDAQVMADLYLKSGGQPIDGVIAIDPAGLAEMLKLVGPISVPAWPEPLTAENANRILLKDQYLRIEERPEREDFLGAVAEEVWRRLTTQQLASIPELLAVLGPAVRDKHIMVSATRGPEQDLYTKLGATGRMAPTNGDFLGVVTQNAGGNKLDAYLSRSIDYRVEVDPSTGELAGLVRITLRNDAPVAELPADILGSYYVPDLPPGTNRVYLSVYTPWALDWSAVDGGRVTLDAESELGRRVYSGGVVVPPGGAVSVEVALSGRLPAGKKYRLDLHGQPTAVPDHVSLSLRLPGDWVVKGTEDLWRDQFDLAADRSVALALHQR